MNLETLYEYIEKIGVMSFSTMYRGEVHSRSAHFNGFDEDGLYFRTMVNKPYGRQVLDTGKLTVCGISNSQVSDKGGNPVFPPSFTLRLIGDVRGLIMKCFVHFSLLVLMVYAVSGCGVAPQPLRVISYNILEGFETDKTMPNGITRKKAVSDWLYEQQPDIVGFQELNGYSEEKLQGEAAQWGHAYAATHKTDGYIVGITSRFPIDVIEKRVEGMHHGLIHVRTNGIDVIVTHFSPFQWSVRNKEATIVAEKVKACLQNNQPVIVMGDLNANSPQDADLVTEDYLRRRKASDDRYDHVQNLENGKVSFTCLQTLLECGLLDVYAPWKENSQVGRRMRIDYILASRDLAKTVQKASWLVQPKFKDYSDHYPVLADFTGLH